MTSAPPLSDALRARILLGRTLVGEGLDLGPGDNPYPLVFGGARAVYCDQWSAEDNQRLFREVDGTGYVDPDLTVDLNVARLSRFGDASQGFVVASHILEHLVEPLGQLEDIHRVLKPGGSLLLFLPDRRRTFDRDRQPTPLEHLLDEHARGVTELDDAHLAEFIQNVPEDWGDAPPPQDKEEQYARHRQRSIHVHCWTEDEFVDVLVHMTEHMGVQWELIDRLVADDVDACIEFGFALRKPTVELESDIAAERLRRVWKELKARTARTTSMANHCESLQRSLNETQAALIETQAALNETQAALSVQIAEGREDSDKLLAAQVTLARHERVLAPLRKVRDLVRPRRRAPG